MLFLFWQVRLLYKGTLRVLLVLLHDFPEFLCDHHFSFCDVIPPSCIQMRNLILSAFPRNMRLPDPFTPNLKVRPLEHSTPDRFRHNLVSSSSTCALWSCCMLSLLEMSKASCNRSLIFFSPCFKCLTSLYTHNQLTLGWFFGSRLTSCQKFRNRRVYFLM